MCLCVGFGAVCVGCSLVGFCLLGGAPPVGPVVSVIGRVQGWRTAWATGRVVLRVQFFLRSLVCCVFEPKDKRP
jgi:hypothetical protein